MTEINEQCLLCGGPLRLEIDALWDDRFGAPGYYAIAQCELCSAEQTVPRLSSDALRALYERFYNFGSGESSSRKHYEKIRDGLLGSCIYRLWLAIDGDISFYRAHSESPGSGRRLLDVGCNEGRGLERYRESGFEAEGLELNRVAAEVARLKGFKVYTEEIDALRTPELFDVIVFSNVLEHFRDPRTALRVAHRLLGKRGEVWISLPNAESVMKKIFGGRWINWHVPYHLVHFSSKTLLNTLRQEGFVPFSVKTVTPALWIVQALLTLIYAKPGQPTVQLRRVSLVAGSTIGIRALFFPLLWLVNVVHRGDALLVRARRAD